MEQQLPSKPPQPAHGALSLSLSLSPTSSHSHQGQGPSSPIPHASHDVRAAPPMPQIGNDGEIASGSLNANANVTQPPQQSAHTVSLTDPPSASTTANVTNTHTHTDPTANPPASMIGAAAAAASSSPSPSPSPSSASLAGAFSGSALLQLQQLGGLITAGQTRMHACEVMKTFICVR